MIQYFGQYLLNLRVITRQQLLDAIHYQETNHQKIGILAIDKGYLSAHQVDHILRVQQEQNKPIGHIAVNEGMLTSQQVEELLVTQKTDHVLLGEALLEKKILTTEELATHLKAYRMQQIESEQMLDWAYRNLPAPLLGQINLGVNIATNVLMRLVDMPCKVASIQKLAELQPLPSDFFAYQDTTGPASLAIAFGLKEQTLLYLASRMLHRKILTADELALDSVQEIINVITGHVCTAFSNMGYPLEAAPPLSVPTTQVKNLFQDRHWIHAHLKGLKEELDLYFLMT